MNSCSLRVCTALIELDAKRLLAYFRISKLPKKLRFALSFKGVNQQSTANQAHVFRWDS